MKKILEDIREDSPPDSAIKENCDSLDEYLQTQNDSADFLHFLVGNMLDYA